MLGAGGDDPRVSESRANLLHSSRHPRQHPPWHDKGREGGNVNCVTKALAVTALSVFVAAAGWGQAQQERTDAHGRYTEEKEICGPTVQTPELHNVKCGQRPGCRQPCDRWCFVPNPLSVKTPDPRWVFSGAPRVDCAANNQGSCEWNALGKPDRFSITLNNPDEIDATEWTNSRSIGIRLCAPARYYP
jgi:hypothetical protein